MQHVHDKEWNVKSVSGCNRDGYSVKHIQECSPSTCSSSTSCTEAECGFLCSHMYSCDHLCYDYNNGHVCKHIHRVHSMVHQEKVNICSPSSQEVCDHVPNDFDTVSYTGSIFDSHKGIN